jgi:hypothetical protein
MTFDQGDTNMRITQSPARFLASLAALLLISGLGTLAGNGRDFVGMYETSDELETGNEISMTLAVEIFNHSGTDVLGAAVRLENPLDPDTPHATWMAVDIAHKNRCILSGMVTLPARERDQWRKGGMPPVTIEYQDASGLTVRKRVELAFNRVILQEDQP